MSQLSLTAVLILLAGVGCTYGSEVAGVEQLHTPAILAIYF